MLCCWSSHTSTAHEALCTRGWPACHLLVTCIPGMQSPCLQCCWNIQHSRLAPFCHAASACTLHDRPACTSPAALHPSQAGPAKLL